MKNAFITDIRSIQKQTRNQLDAFGKQDETVSFSDYSQAVNHLISAKQLCYQRYIQHAYLCSSLQTPPMEKLFGEFAEQHLEEIESLKRSLSNSSAEVGEQIGDNAKIRVSLYTVSSGVNRMIKENLTAERLCFGMVIEAQNALDHVDIQEKEPLVARLEEIASRQEARLNRLADLLEF